MSNKLWLVKNVWNNHGEYEDARDGTRVFGVFDDFNLAAEAVNRVYENEVNLSVIYNALAYARYDGVLLLPYEDIYITGYEEFIYTDNIKSIGWTVDHGWGWPEETYDYEYVISLIEVNKSVE